ncbi:MAG: hypothetical protein QOE30_5321 [Mycobacterium sp.]|jgi:hypothetical protein|uniref:hypothetical protein n=1 Tax=Mycobacterium sp. TaxID=1785 RepID=UPI0028BAA62E|nr:hypothetical protein [Mycobacterium sp.]MDT5119582.1 hypothetical protein [Mycobacterium sp.]
MPVAMPIFGASNAWITPSLVASACALLFTVGSFWWIQVRRGQLRSYPPQVYSAAFTPNKIIIVLPLVIHNPAPAPLAVIGLRLWIESTEDRAVETDALRTDRAALPGLLPWIACRADIYSDKRTYNAPFAVDGRRVVEKFVEFQWERPPVTLDNGPYVATVEVRTAPSRWWQKKDQWRRLMRFELNTQLSAESRASFLARTNDLGFTGPATRAFEGQ